MDVAMADRFSITSAVSVGKHTHHSWQSLTVLANVLSESHNNQVLFRTWGHDAAMSSFKFLQTLGEKSGSSPKAAFIPTLRDSCACVRACTWGAILGASVLCQCCWAHPAASWRCVRLFVILRRRSVLHAARGRPPCWHRVWWAWPWRRRWGWRSPQPSCERGGRRREVLVRGGSGLLVVAPHLPSWETHPSALWQHAWSAWRRVKES